MAAHEAAGAAMDWTADHGSVPITKDDIEKMDPIWWRISKQDHHSLSKLITGGAQRMVRNVKDKDVVEALRAPDCY